MAGQAELAPRYELGDRRLVMACCATGMGVDGCNMSYGDLRGSVAGRAIGLGRMVIVMAGNARFGPWLRLERDWDAVTILACDSHVSRVFEDHRPGSGSMIGNCDLQG